MENMKICGYCGSQNDSSAELCANCGQREFGEVSPSRASSGGRPWVGILLSLIVPGFGFARSHQYAWAISWYLGLKCGFAVVALFFVLDGVPPPLRFLALGCWFGAELVMLWRSYRPGRATLLHVLALIGLVVLGRFLGTPAALVARPFKASTNSMSPTLRGGAAEPDHFLVDRLSYKFSLPKRGDLLVYRTEGIPGLQRKQIYVKRIVGMPGERLTIRGGAVYADRKRLLRRDGIPPIHYLTREAVEKGDETSIATYQVDTNGYFVLGDNPANSLDSRYHGSVPRSNVYGKVAMIYYPFPRAGRPEYPMRRSDDAGPKARGMGLPVAELVP